MQKMRVRSQGQEELDKEIATHSSILAWEIPWTEEPGGLQPIRWQTVGHDWATAERDCWEIEKSTKEQSSHPDSGLLLPKSSPLWHTCFLSFFPSSFLYNISSISEYTFLHILVLKLQSDIYTSKAFFGFNLSSLLSPSPVQRAVPAVILICVPSVFIFCFWVFYSVYFCIFLKTFY